MFLQCPQSQTVVYTTTTPITNTYSGVINSFEESKYIHSLGQDDLWLLIEKNYRRIPNSCVYGTSITEHRSICGMIFRHSTTVHTLGLFPYVDIIKKFPSPWKMRPPPLKNWPCEFGSHSRNTNVLHDSDMAPWYSPSLSLSPSLTHRDARWE